MTKKDYELLAKALVTTQAHIHADAVQYVETHSMTHFTQQLRGVRRVAAQLATVLAAENPKFNQQRFLTACGYGA
jgi:hypothetical protein